MKRLILLSCLLSLGAPAVAAQSVYAAQPYAQPTPRAQAWNPAADYVTPGQDEPGYRNWYLATPRHAMQVNAFNRYLDQWEVGGIVPTWQLLRTASMWQRCGAQPFEVPPTNEWPNVVQTLRYIRDYVVPAVGPVEPISAYRNPLLNACAGGAPQSSHQHFQAVDLVPLRPTTREQLMRRMCSAHLRRGGPYSVGLGFYAFLRFHVDSMRFRKWGTSGAGEASDCNVVIPRPVLPAPTVVSTSPAVPVIGSTSPQAVPGPSRTSEPISGLPNSIPADPAVGQPDPLAPR